MTTLDDLKRDCFDKTYFNGGDPFEFMDYVDRIIDHLHAQGYLQLWQPIETYDYDGFPQVLLAGYIVPSEYAQENGSRPRWEISVGRCWHVNTRKFTGFLGQQPTHWMPLPKPPEETK